MFTVHEMLPPDATGEVVVRPRRVLELRLESIRQISFWGQLGTRIEIGLDAHIVVQETPDDLARIWVNG